MNIESANYNRDESGNPISIHIVHDGGIECDAPINGSNWICVALAQWLTADPSNQIGG